MIALAGANNKAFHFKEGNRNCVKKIIQNTEKARLQLNSSITKVSRENGLFSLSYQGHEGEQITEKGFDIVVIASPLKDLEIETSNPSIKRSRPPYVKAFVSLVAGTLKCSYFEKGRATVRE